MQKKVFRNLFYFLTDLSFVLFILLATVHFWAFNESFYRSEHRKLKLYGTPLAEYIGISDEKLDELTSFTLAYLNDKDATLDLQMEVKGEMREVYTDDEKLHMVDQAEQLLLDLGFRTLYSPGLYSSLTSLMTNCSRIACC